MGIVCCYINVEQNAFFRNECKSYFECDKFINVHGGVTYFERGLGFHDNSCIIWPNDLVLGYDFGHYDDLKYPGLIHLAFMANTNGSAISEDEAEHDVKRNIRYIRENLDI